MTRTCPCGQDFVIPPERAAAAAKPGRYVYCSRACANRSRPTRTLTSEEREQQRLRRNARQRARCDRNRAEVNAKNVEYRRQNVERVREYDRGRSRGPESDALKERRKLRARARRLGHHGDAVAYAEILRRDPCAYCGAATAGTVDHIEPLALEGGHDWDNLTAACVSCNPSKNDTPLLVWLATGARVDAA